MGCKLSKLCANSEEEHDSYEPVRVSGEAATGSRPNRPTRITTPADLDKPSEGRSGSAANTARATDTPISTSNHEPKLRDDLDSSLVDPASAGSIPTNPELPDGITNESSRSSTTPFICTPDSPATEASVSSSKTMIPPEPPTIPSNLEPQFQGEELLITSVAGEATLMGATGGNYSAARTSGFAISGLIHTAATTTTNTGDTGVLGGPVSPAAQSFSSPTDQKPLTLWEQALKKVPRESIIYPGGRAAPVGGLAQNLIDEVERKKLECDSKRWFYNKNDNKVFIVETLLVQLNKYATIGDVMIQHNPDIVALVWGGFRGLLQVGTAYVDQMRSVSENVDYLVQLLCSCQIYEKLYCQETLGISENLTKSLVDLYASILKFLCYTNQYLDHNTLARIFKSFSQEMGRLLAEIKSQKATVEDNISIAEREVSSLSRFNQEQGFVAMKSDLAKIQEPLDDLRRVTELIYSTVKNDRRLKILGWLSKVEYEGHHILSQRRRQDGTGSWLFKNDAFVRWSGSEKSSILWLRADAGFGKTILACTIVDHFGYLSGKDDHVVAYFYCNYKEPDRRDAASILRTLVKQFCVKKGDQKVPTLIEKLYEAREKNGHANGPLSPEENTELIINLSERYQSTTLIIDALDECDVGTRKSLFSSLHTIVQRTTRVKIVVTSRYDDDINDSFSSGLCYYIDDKDNSADINLYVDAELDRRCDPKNAHDYELLLKGKVDPELNALIRSRLKERSNGMFMWVNLQINALCATRTTGGVKEALDRMPGTLNETYQQVLERIKSQDLNSHRVATIVLKWLLCAQEACTVGSVIQALAIDPGDAELNQDGLTWTIPDILGICKSLVVHDESLGIFRFAHFSVQEFLVVDPGFGRESSNAHVAGVCVTALLYHHGDPEGSSIAELYAYAMRYWGDHVRLSGATPGGLETLCMGFFKSSIAYNRWGSRAATETFPSLRPSAGENITIVRPLFVASFYGLRDLCRLLLAGPENLLNSVNVDGQSPLIISSLRNHEQVVKVLLEREDIDINLGDKKGKTALYRAASHGHETIVHMLLQKGDVAVNSKSEKDKIPLQRAAGKGHDKVVRQLLERDDVDVNWKDSWTGQSPLSLAAYYGRDKVVQLLLEREDVDVNSKDSREGQSPLSWAASSGHDKVVQLLLERKGVDVNSKDYGNEWSPLSWAVTFGHEKVVQLLLEREDVDVNSKDNRNGRSPLSLAAECGYEKVVQLLLERKGVDVNSKDYGNEWSPLSWAVTFGHEKVVQLLLEREDVDVNSKDNRNGRSPLSLAAECGYEKVVQRLLARGDVDVNSKDNGSGRSPLSWAADKGHTGVIRLLLKREELDVNSKEDVYDGQSTLFWVVRMRRDEVVQLLLERKDVDVNSKDNRTGQSALSWAAKWGHDNIVQLLLERDDVDVNSKDRVYGRSPLSWAARCGRGKMVQLLLERKDVDVNSKDSVYGKSPLSWAVEMDQETIILLLLEREDLDVNSKENRNGKSLLFWAFERGYPRVVQQLLEREDLDVNSKDNRNGRSPLSWAARWGDDKVVQLLLEREDVDVNSKDSVYRQSPLSWAVEMDHQNVIQLLLKREDVDVNSKQNRNGRSPLSWAAKRGHEDVVQLLLAREDVDVNSKDNRTGRSPLSWAVEMGHKKVMELLLKREDVDMNSKDNRNGRSPLCWAARWGHDKVVQLLLEREDLDVNSKDNRYGRSPLSWAARWGHDKVVQLLLEREDVDVNSKDNRTGQSALSWAAKWGHDKVVQLLLEREDVNVNSEINDNVCGQSPLCWAVMMKHDKVMQLLLEREEVDVNSKDSVYGQSALSLAVRMRRDEVVQLLLEREDVDVNSKDSVYGQSPLFWAASCGHKRFVQLLLDREDVDVNSKDSEYGRCILSSAAMGNQDKVVQLLLGMEDVDVNSKDSMYGQSPLSWAAEMGHVKVVRLLLKRDDVDVNSKDSRKGRSPLSWAAIWGHVKVVKLLLKRKNVDVNSEDLEGRTALHHAQMWDHARVVKLLEPKVANARSPPEAAPPAPGDDLSSFDV